MSLSHALLTSLIERPSSGYDLARRFDKSIGFFWQATHQQIYRELSRMEAAGWITSEAAPDGGKTRKRLYTVLPDGRTELARWAREPSPPAPMRDDFMVRMRADAAIGPLGLAAELKARHSAHASQLEAYRAIEARDFPPGKALTREGRIQRLILQTGIRYEEAWMAWTEEALQVIEDR